MSQGLYVRHGLFPRFPIYNLGVARDVLTGRLQGAVLRSVPLKETASHLRNLARIDSRALDVSGEKHHRYLINDDATKGVILYAGDDCVLYAGDDCVGYAYVGTNGHIGPLAVTQSNILDAAFRTALNLAAETGSVQVSAFLPGTTENTLSTAVEHGMRITLPMVLMSTRDLGNWSQYLPRNPGFM